MKKVLAFLIIVCCPMATVVSYAQDDDFGLDFSLNAEKKIRKGVDFSLEGGSLALAAGTANSADAFALTADSTLSFGDGAAISLESLSIPDGATLTLAGNVPSRGLRVSSDPGEETLGRIVFADGRRGTVVWDSNGYVRANGKGLIISVY